jgi:hypothetical protein
MAVGWRTTWGRHVEVVSGTIVEVALGSVIDTQIILGITGGGANNGFGKEFISVI